MGNKDLKKLIIYREELNRADTSSKMVGNSGLSYHYVNIYHDDN